MDVDEIIRALTEEFESGVREDADGSTTHGRMLKLVKKIHEISDLIEFESEEIWSVFDQIIAQEILEISNFETVVEMAKLAHEMELPYRSFWASMVNMLLLNHQEF